MVPGKIWIGNQRRYLGIYFWNVKANLDCGKKGKGRLSCFGSDWVALFQNSYLSKFYQSYTWGLQPVPEYLYNTDIQITPSRCFALYLLPVLTSHFHPLFSCNLPPFTLLISFQNNFIFPFTSSLIYLPNCSFNLFLSDICTF